MLQPRHQSMLCASKILTSAAEIDVSILKDLDAAKIVRGSRRTSLRGARRFARTKQCGHLLSIAGVGNNLGLGGGSPTSTATAVDDAGSGQESIEQDYAAVGAELVAHPRAADVAASLAQVLGIKPCSAVSPSRALVCSLDVFLAPWTHQAGEHKNVPAAVPGVGC